MPEAILTLVRRASLRMRVQGALEVAARIALGSAALSLVLVYVDRVWGLPARLDRVWPILVVLAPVIAAAVRLLGRVELERAAARLDARFQLQDRLRIALELSGRTWDPMAALAVGDAAAIAGGLDARLATPLRAPSSLAPSCILLGVAIAVGHLRFDQPPPPRRPARPIVKIPSLLVAEAEEIKRALAGSEAKEVDLVAEQISKVLAELADGKIDRREALARLSALEEQHLSGLGGHAEALREAARRAGTDLEPSKLATPLARALKAGDLAKAAEALAELEKKLASENQADATRARRALSKAAQTVASEAQKKTPVEELMERRLQRAEKEQRSLEKAAEKSQDAKSAAERNRRELDRLRRERDQLQKRSADRRRALDKLKRSLSRAGADRGQQQEPQQGKQGKESQSGGDQQEVGQTGEANAAPQAGAEESGESGESGEQKGNRGAAARELKKLEALERARGRLSELRAGLSQGESGGEGGQRARLRSFSRRAGGGSGGESPGGGGRERGSTPGGESSAAGPSDSYGNGAGAPVAGEETARRAPGRDEALSGVQGEGPSRSQVIRDATSRGFSSRTYQRVYRDYSGVVEETLERDDVPPGYRAFVRRYFELIRPH